MRLYTTVIFCFLFFAGFAQRPELSSFKTAQEKLHAWSEYCDKILNKEDWPLLRSVAKEGLAMTAAADNYNLSLFNFYIGITFNYSTEADSAIGYLETSEASGRKAGNFKRITEALKQLLNACNSYGKSQKLRRALDGLQHIADTAKTVKVKADILESLADYYSNQGQYEKALEYQLIGITARKEGMSKAGHTDSINLGVLIQNVGELYLNLSQPEKTIEYAKESSKYLLDYKEATYHVNKDMVDAYLMLNDIDSANAYYDQLNEIVQQNNGGWPNLVATDLSFAEYYLGKKNNEQALAYVDHATALSPKGIDPFLVSQVNYMKGKTYVALKNYDKALQFLLKAEPVAKEGPAEIYSSVQRSLAEAYAATGQWQQAYAHFLIHNNLQDTLLSEAAKHNIAEMEAKFQNKDKQQRIEGLSAENTIKTLQVKNAERQKIFFVTGLLLLLAIVGSLIVTYRNKQRSSQLLQQKNEQMNVLNESLEKANSTKAKLFSIISHDLRSPISQVYQFLDLQKNDPHLFSEADKIKHNEEISRSAGTLLETMEDLLIWSKTQMQQFTLNKEKVNAAQLISNIVDLLDSQSSPKKITIIQNIPGDIYFVTDRNIINIIVRNLLQNAIRYSPENSSIKVAAKNEKENMIFSIADEGKGMPEEIRQLFNENNSAITSAQSGLGLTIVKEMADLIQATIHITANQPTGTLIDIALPQ